MSSESISSCKGSLLPRWDEGELREAGSEVKRSVNAVARAIFRNRERNSLADKDVHSLDVEGVGGWRSDKGG
jgi:hypothetical protein